MYIYTHAHHTLHIMAGSDRKEKQIRGIQEEVKKERQKKGGYKIWGRLVIVPLKLQRPFILSSWAHVCPTRNHISQLPAVRRGLRTTFSSMECEWKSGAQFPPHLPALQPLSLDSVFSAQLWPCSAAVGKEPESLSKLVGERAALMARQLPEKETSDRISGHCMFASLCCSTWSSGL